MRWPLLLATGALTVATRAQAAPPTVTLSPAVATWQDDVHVVIAGSTSGCADAPFTMEPSVQTISSLRYRLILQLAQSCPDGAPPSTRPLAIAQDVGHLAAGVYDVMLQSPAHATVAVSSFDVFEVGTAQLSLASPVTDAAAGTVHVQGVAYADSPLGAVADGAFVDLGTLVDCTVPFPIPEQPPQPPLGVVSTDLTLPVLAAGDYELRAFTGCGFPQDGSIPPPHMLALSRVPLHVWRHDRCIPADGVLCLQDGRFQVTGTWRAFDGTTGAAHVASLAADDGSGLLWFFDAANPELTVKIVDGCTLDDAWWVFLASGSNVAYTITVRDTTTGAEKTYTNALGAVPPLVADTSAFARCP